MHDSECADDDEKKDATRCACVKEQRVVAWDAERQTKSGDMGEFHDEGDDTDKTLDHQRVPFVWRESWTRRRRPLESACRENQRASPSPGARGAPRGVNCNESRGATSVIRGGMA